jgi:uncharacterized protein
VKLLRSKDYHRMQWKNGGGETSEIVAYPEGADLTNFGWRISMAVVASNGPFSSFPKIDRTLTILEGDGLWLTVGEKRQFLGQKSEPLSFPADIPTSATLAGGAVIDLNVMTRRGQFTHQVKRLECRKAMTFDHANDATIIFSASGDLDLSSAQRKERLQAKDCVILSGSKPFQLQGDGLAYLITIENANTCKTSF